MKDFLSQAAKLLKELDIPENMQIYLTDGETILLSDEKELAGREITKEFLLTYRDGLMQKYKPQTVNGNISAINAFLTFCGLPDMRLMRWAAVCVIPS